jgi:hypothetical protein
MDQLSGRQDSRKANSPSEKDQSDGVGVADEITGRGRTTRTAAQDREQNAQSIVHATLFVAQLMLPF